MIGNILFYVCERVLHFLRAERKKKQQTVSVLYLITIFCFSVCFHSDYSLEYNPATVTLLLLSNKTCQPCINISFL